MRTQSTDPDIRKYDPKDDVSPCPECHQWMLPLEEYELPVSETPTIECEIWEFLLWGWMAFVYNYLYDVFTIKGRREKLARLKAEVLPVNPKSLVCPACLHVVRK